MSPRTAQAADPGSFGCSSEQRFTRVYGLGFALERRSARGGAPRVDLEQRGQAYLFLHVERDDLVTFDEELRRGLAGLAADAFVDDFAGLTPQGGPLSRICLASRPSRRGAVSRRLEPHRVPLRASRQGNRTENARSSARGSPAAPSPPLPLACARPVSPCSAPRSSTSCGRCRRRGRCARRRCERGDRRRTSRRPLAPRTWFRCRTGSRTRSARRRAWRGAASRQSQNSRVKASFARDGVRIAAEVSPAEFPPYVVATRGWLARWTIDTLDRELGSRPSETLGPTSQVRTALVATLPPAPVDREGRQTRAAPPETVEPVFDAEAYIGEIANRLDRAARLDVDAVASAVSADPAGLGTQGWILFVCRERSATFELLPTRASQEVVNAGELCAAIDRVLARAGAD